MGDIHGCLDLALRLLEAVRADTAARRPEARPLLVLLGDYVDRGPDARGVIDLVVALQAEGAFQVAALRGNHEAAMLDFLDDPTEGAAWLDYGGVSTLHAYGVAPPTEVGDLPAVRDALARALPPAHLQFLHELPLCAVLGGYLFVHAGVRPGVALEAQADQDLLWIREPFLSHPRPSPLVVVHGHTPAREPFAGEGRIGVDTGAFATGILTAVRLEGATRAVLQVRAARAPAAPAIGMDAAVAGRWP